MANKITFASLKLKPKTDVKEVPLEDGHILEVKQYLPIEDKVDLIQIALQKAEENGVYNNVLLNMYFDLNVVYLYSNITFTDRQKEDEFKLYDILEENGIIAKVVDNIPEAEYNELVQHADVMKKDILKYKNTAGAVLQSVIQDLPKNAAAAKEIVDSFDQNKFQAVVDFATAANGGRNIKTNQPADILPFKQNNEDINN